MTCGGCGLCGGFGLMTALLNADYDGLGLILVVFGGCFRLFVGF